MKRMTLALRLIGRDWRSGEIKILLLAVIIAVASVTSVAFFANRIQQLLELQANVLMGADQVISSDHPIGSELLSLAHQFNLRTARTISFLSMVQTNGHNQLTAIKAVSATYPLRGELRVTSRRFTPDHVTQNIPAEGTVWVDERLLGELSIHVGDSVRVGNARFKVSAVITHEPDRGGLIFNIAPRLLMNQTDVPVTGLIQPGSRVRYRLLLAGETTSLKNYRKAIKSKLERGEHIETVEDASPQMRTALERSRQFLGLASMVSVMLAGVAMAMAVRRFVSRHLDNVAILRTFGATTRDIAVLYGWQLFMLGTAASALGCIVGYIAQEVLSYILGSLAASTLPEPSLIPVIVGMVVGLLTLGAFTVPPLLHLRHVPTLRVLRRDIGTLPKPSMAAYLLGVTALAAITIWQSDNLRLGLMVLGGSAVTVLILAITASAVLALLMRSRHKVSASWRFGIANLTRRAQGNVVQVVAFGIGMLALLLLGVVRVDLLADWKASLPPKAPNRFVINIQPEQIKPISDFFKDNGLAGTKLFPMVRGRLTAINNKPVSPDNYKDQRARHLAEREFNLSWAKELQSGNSIVSGHWWTGTHIGQPQLSVEEGIARTLGISLGDKLTYQIGGSMFAARVTNIRKVEWDSFHVNFFVIATPGSLDGFPVSYITSFYLPRDQVAVLGRLVHRFPNITIIDVAAIMDQVRQVIERVTLALEYVFAFTVLAGMMVLYAAIQSTLDERLLEGALLRTLGASRRQLLGGMAVEFAGIGLISGLIAASGAAVAGYMLAEHVFHFTYHLNVALWLWGGMGGMVTVAIAGLWGTRFILGFPPWQTLRELQGT